MAESAVSLVLGKLADPIIQEAILLNGVSGDVDWLASEMRWIKSFLKDAEAKRRRDGSELIKNWIRDVREVAELAEDIIDTLQQQRQQTGCITRYVCLPFESIISRHKVGTSIQQLRAKIQQIKASRETHGLVDLGETNTTWPIDEALHARRRIAPHLDNDDAVLVGFDSHKEAIIGQLLDADTNWRCVVSIVGTGGIGKTTLATKIYNHSKIRTGFDIHACVSVSQVHQYDDTVRKIAKQVSAGVFRNELQSMEIDDLERELKEFLKERRYFVVLDDVWSKDVWDRASKVLPDTKNGSRVLVTTRSIEVATSANSHIHQLPFLDDTHSWELFLKIAFPRNRDANPSLCCPEALEEVGRKVVKRCGGLPLALVVLGGLLSRKDPSYAEWARVANRMDWASTKDGQDCLNILALSYDHLPHHHLKSCFLYLAVYPRDWEITESEAVNLWVAEGLIPEARTRTMEETARSYLNELAERSMIQLNYKSWETCPTYRLHALFHDFCINETRNDGFLSVYCPYIPPGEMRLDQIPCRRLALHDFSTNEVKGRFSAPKLRSILAFGTESNNDEVFNGPKLLRVVHLESRKILTARFPKQLLESSIHLRYLCLRMFLEPRELPLSIGSLRNLQTLDVEGTGICKLPDSVGKIQTLRHLYLPRGCECTPSICNLTKLKTLVGANAVGEGMTQKLVLPGGWIELGSEKLVNIETLRVFELRATQGEVFFHSLRKMKGLTCVELYTHDVISADSFVGFSDHDQLFQLYLEGQISRGHLVFPPSLTTLQLCESELEQDPMAVLEKLPNLTSLQLSVRSYKGAGMVCTAGSFPSLQQLHFDCLFELEEWRVECGALPKLMRLQISHCRRLAMLPEGLPHLTSLKHLEVYNCTEEFMRRLEGKVGVGKDWYKIQHLPTVIITPT